ncbi:DUF185 domain containing protein [Niveomyces insectorum RCEF 264]|uniref:Protein arginine methyltransferase NDUFAF7 n=1 Tax=Niveomyces insectorum RCEF 264 TaxID=1081102 RepID=A0A167QX07_9HYPO|nr:DUF185 domain containing protein [Niveomyces insectorum RCEF 264]
MPSKWPAGFLRRPLRSLVSLHCCPAFAQRSWRLPPAAALAGRPVARRRDFSSSVGRRNDAEERKWSTPLAKQLAEAISTTGPIPLASYMRMCLTSDLGGYYTGALADTGRDPFGRTGDFVTSPEVSQVFGELVGIWFVAEWMAQGRPARGVELIEVGPGRGTLMDDILRTIRHFGLAKSIDAVYLVEASAQLRDTQKELLCGPNATLTESKTGYHGVSARIGLPIVWTETIQAVPKNPDSMPLIVAHEFFDALPIHAFQAVSVPVAQGPPTPSTPPPSSSSAPPSTSSPPKVEWREMVVSPTPPGATHDSLGTPRSQRPPPLPGREEEGDGGSSPVPDFQLTLASGTTRYARYLPEMSARYRALLQTVGPGAVIEVCPDAALYAAEFALRIGGGRSSSSSSKSSSSPASHPPKRRPAGAALVLDYGPGDGTVPVNSLRGIRRHQRVSPFAEPGLTDLSADVDFAALAEAATQASDGVEVHGPVDQADFLLTMGIRERASALASKAVASSSTSSSSTGGGSTKAADIERAWKRLVDRGPNGMGKVYKALAIVPENGGRRRPVGFGGDVVQ